MPVMNWRELQSLNRRRQSTGYDDDIDQEISDSMDGVYDDTFDYDGYEGRPLNILSPEERKQVLWKLSVTPSPEETYTNEDVIESGYGDEKIDYRVPFSQWRQNPIDARANAQSWMEKFGNGAAKMIPFFGTTLLDNTIGTVLGIANLVQDAVDGDGEFHGRDSFINNYGFGETMQAWRDGSEKLAPNFRSIEEMEDADEWWKHLNGNFWGDTFLKNFGFTLGAGAAFWGWGKGVQALGSKIINKAYKSAMAAAAGDAKAMEGFQRVLRGGAMKNPAAAYKVFDGTSKAFNGLNWASQIIGGIGGATGEARMEALMAAKEFRDENKQRESDGYERKREELFDRVSKDTSFRTVQDRDQYLADELSKLQEDYMKTLEHIEFEANLLAKRTFSLNLPILTASNIIMFGRLASGGFNTQAGAKLKLRNGKYVENVPGITGVTRAIGNATSEGMEELLQKMASEGSKNIAENNMAAFHNKQYDKDAIKWGSEWLMSMLDSAGNVALDPKSWEEFAVGFLTGAIGMPAKGGWSGGIVGGFQSANQQRKESEDAAERLNKVISRPEFADQWRSIVRHKKLEDQKSVALSDNDRYAWKTADDEQMISDVIAFAKAGKLDDLEAIVDSFGKVNEGDIDSIRNSLIDDSDTNLRNKSNAQLVDWLHGRVRDVKKTINQYRRFHDAIDFMSMGTTDDEVINEMIYTKSQLENFEDRYKNIVAEALNDVKPRLQEVAKRRDRMDNYIKEAKIAQRILSSESDLTTLFGGMAVDVQDRDEDGSNEDRVAVMIDDAQQEHIISLLEDLGVFADKPDTKQKVKDLQKLVRTRQSFYSRLFFPDNRKSFAERFQQEAKTDTDVVHEIRDDARQNFVNRSIQQIKQNASNLRGYIRMMNTLTAPDPDTEASLMDAIRSDEELNKFEEQLEEADKFVGDITDILVKKINANTDPVIAEIYKNIESELLDVETMNELADIGDNDDPVIHLARKILAKVGTTPEAEQEIRKIFDELLSDRAQSNNLGYIEPNPGNGGGNGGGRGGNGGGGGGVSSFDHIQALIDNISDVYNKDLEKFANGNFEGYDDLTEDEMSKLSGIAQAKLTELKIKFGLISDPNAIDPQIATEPDDDSPSRKIAKEARIKKEMTSISGARTQYYAPGTTDPQKSTDTKYVNEWGLRQGLRNPFKAQSVVEQSVRKWYSDHKVQDFVDSGALMALEKEYQKKGQHLPIYIVGNPHFVENNVQNNPFVSKNTNKKSKFGNISAEMLFAIEMNDENKNILKRFEGTAYTSDSQIDVYDNGKLVKYQVIGKAWNIHPDDIAKKPEEYREGYQDMSDHVRKLWEYAIYRSIIPQYRADKSAIGDTGQWYVAKNHPLSVGESGDPDVQTGERIYTNLNYVMSGRNETRSIQEPGYTKVELRNSLNSYKKIGGEYYFAMPTKEQVIVSASRPRDCNFPPEIHAALGSLWMATRTANGKFSWSYIDIARTGEYNFEANSSSPLIQDINKSIDRIFEVGNKSKNQVDRRKDFKERHEACKFLSRVFYLGEGNMISFYYTAGGVELDIAGRVCRSKQDVFDALNEGNYRFQISSDDVYDGAAAIEPYIEAGILRSEMRSFIRMGATFGVNFLEDTDKDGNKVELHPVSYGDEIAYTAGERSVTGYSNTNGISDIKIGDTGYRLKEGKVYYMAAGERVGEEVTQRERVAQVKSLAEVLELMSNRRFENKRVMLSSYPGRAWVVERSFPKKKDQAVSTNYQYVEMFEREMDGFTIHMARWGKNGAVQLVWDDGEWNDLMELAKQANVNDSKYRGQTEDEKKASDAEILAQLDRIRAEEEGGTTAAPQAKPTPTRRGRINKPSRGGIKPISSTPQQEEKKDKDTIDKTDCG